MANNEDYLDSLLMAAQSQGDPNSAIEMIRKMESGVKASEQDNGDKNANNESLQAAEDTAANLLAELNAVQSESDFGEVTNAENASMEDVDALLNSLTLENNDSENIDVSAANVITAEPAVPEIPVVSEEPAVTETPVVSEEPAVMEVPVASEESAVTEMPVIPDEPSIPEISEESVEAAIDEEPAAPVISGESLEAEIPSDIDALLSSDFSGEIELPSEDISGEASESEMTSLDDFANILASEDSASAPVEMTEAAPQIDDYDEAIKMMNSGLFKEKPNSGDSGDMKSLEELALEMDDVAAMEAELGIHDKNDIASSLSADDYALAGDAEALNEISGLLDAIDSNEVSSSDDFDVLSMVNAALTKQEAEDEAASLEEKKKKEKNKKEKAKKEKKKRGKKAKDGEENGEPSENADVEALGIKKKGFFGRLMDFLTAEEDDPDNLIQATDEAGKSSEGFEDVKGENKEILEEIDKEEDEKGKKKKKKKKDKKNKKGEKPASDEEGDDSEDGGDKKGKKAKKPKKEKKPLELDVDTGKPLSKRNVRLVAILAASLLVAIILFCTIVPKVIVNSQARKAFYKGDYETTYNTFFGENKLSESDQILFSKSEIILKITHKYDAYRAYNNLNMPMEALDQLLQAVKNYELWFFAAESVGAEQEFGLAYAKILGALLGDYELTEDAAREINALPTDEEYSLKVYSVVNHTEYIDPETPLPAPFTPPTEEETNNTLQYSDMLEEEGN